MYELLPTRLRSAAVTCGRIFPAWRERTAAQPFVSLLDQVEHWSTSEIEAYQVQQLQSLLVHCAQYVPYYRELFSRLGLDPAQFNRLEQLYQYPLLTKTLVRKNTRELTAESSSVGRVYAAHTSGTTGAPLSFLIDGRTRAMYDATVIARWQWWSVPADQWIASLGGHSVIAPGQLRPPFWVWDVPDHLLILSSLHLNTGAMAAMVSLLRRSKIQYLKGYPSNLRTLAEYLKANNEFLQLSHVMTGSEPLLPTIRELLRERFRCDVSDYYGNTKRTAIAYECSHHSYHLAETFTYVEVVDENGAPVRDGEEGKLVGTCLTNYAMPLIRYRTGDRSRVLRERCACGRELRVIAPVETKMEDCVVGRDGRIISPSSLTHPFKPIRPLAIEESQIVQVRDGEVEIRIVPGPEYTQDSADQLIAGFHQRLGDSLEVHVHLVDAIERTPVGKLRWVVRRSEGNR